MIGKWNSSKKLYTHYSEGKAVYWCVDKCVRMRYWFIPNVQLEDWWRNIKLRSRKAVLRRCCLCFCWKSRNPIYVHLRNNFSHQWRRIKRWQCFKAQTPNCLIPGRAMRELIGNTGARGCVHERMAGRASIPLAFIRKPRGPRSALLRASSRIYIVDDTRDPIIDHI